MMRFVLALLLAAATSAPVAAALDCNPEAMAPDAADMRAPMEAYRAGMAALQADRFDEADRAFRRAYGGSGQQVPQLELASAGRLVETALAAQDLRTAWYRLRLVRNLAGDGPRPGWIDALIMLADAATADVAERVDVLQTISSCRSFGVAPAISLRILFETNSAALDAQGQAQVARVAAALQAAQITKATLRGHTDEHGSDAYNDGLSKARAETVAKALADAVPGLRGQLQAEGRGERDLLYKQTGAEQDRLNRRVELILGQP